MFNVTADVLYHIFLSLNTRNHHSRSLFSNTGDFTEYSDVTDTEFTSIINQVLFSGDPVEYAIYDERCCYHLRHAYYLLS